MLGLPGGSEWIIILVVVLLLFGAKRVPELFRSLGSGMHEFKKGLNGVADDKPDDTQKQA